MSLIIYPLLTILLHGTVNATAMSVSSSMQITQPDDSVFAFTLLDSIKRFELDEALQGTSQQERDSLYSTFKNSSWNPFQNTFWENANITSTPDNLYKIVVYSGRQCGANCSPIFEAEVFTHRHERIKTDKDLNLYPIQSIYKLKETGDQYLILQNSAARYRITGLVGKEASILQIDSTGAKQICITNHANCSYGAMQPGYITVKPTMDFDSSSGILHFSYYKTDVDETPASTQDTIIAETILFTGDTMKILERQFTPVIDLRYYNR